MSFDAGYTTSMLLHSGWIGDTQKYGSNRDTRKAAAHVGDVVFSVPPSGFQGGFRNDPSCLTVFPTEAKNNSWDVLYSTSKFLGVVTTGTPLGADPLGSPEIGVKLDGKTKIMVRNPDPTLLINVGDRVYARPPDVTAEKPMRGERNTAIVTNVPGPRFQLVGRALCTAGPGQPLDVVLNRS